MKRKTDWEANMFKIRRSLLALSIAILLASSAFGSELTDSLKPGTPDLKSVSALAFGPEGILFAADWAGGTVYAFDTQDRTASSGSVESKGINQKIAAMLGVAPNQILINDIAANPISKKVYISVSRGRGPSAVPVILRVDSQGRLEQFSVANVKHSKVMINSIPANKPSEVDVAGGLTADHEFLRDRALHNPRLQAVTDLEYIDGRLYIAGLSTEEFSSQLRSVAFPFASSSNGSGIKIFHAAHGRFETEAPIRTFVPYAANGKPYIFAAYGCTPLVKIPMSALQAGAKVTGETIAELGSGSTPLDMIVYKKGNADFILMATTTRGVMKLPLARIDTYASITQPSDITGVPYEKINAFNGVFHLDKLDDKSAVVLERAGTDSFDLKTVLLP
jgi:hypothetical protein